MAYEDRWLFVVLQSIALAGTLAVPVLLMRTAWRGEASMRVRNLAWPLAIFVAGTLFALHFPWFSAHVTGFLFDVLSPGAFRLASGVLLGITIWRHDGTESQTPSRAQTAPLGVAVGAMLGLLVILAVAAFNPSWAIPLKISAGGLGLAAIELIGAVAGAEVWNRLLAAPDPDAQGALRGQDTDEPPEAVDGGEAD